MIVYSTGIGDTIPLLPYRDQDDLQFRLARLTHNSGNTNTSLGLRTLRTMFLQQGRDGVPHIGMLTALLVTVAPKSWYYKDLPGPKRLRTLKAMFLQLDRKRVLHINRLTWVFVCQVVH